MVKFKSCNCPNCGANIKYKEGEEKVTCTHCNSDILVEKDLDYEIKKEALSTFKRTNKINKIGFITVGIIIVLIVGIMIFFGIRSFMDTGVNTDTFNFKFTYSSGKRDGNTIAFDLDNIIESNSKYKDHQIYVEYKDESTNDKEEILIIRDNLNAFNFNYNVSLDYDEEGYLNKYTISIR